MDGGLCVQEFFLDNGDKELVGVTQVESVSTKTENGIIDEIWGARVVMFKGSDTYSGVGVLCSVCRVKTDIQFARAAVQLIDDKEGDIEAMILAIHKSSMGWLNHYEFLLLYSKLHGFFLGQRTEIWG